MRVCMCARVNMYVCVYLRPLHSLLSDRNPRVCNIKDTQNERQLKARKIDRHRFMRSPAFRFAHVRSHLGAAARGRVLRVVVEGERDKAE